MLGRVGLKWVGPCAILGSPLQKQKNLSLASKIYRKNSCAVAHRSYCTLLDFSLQKIRSVFFKTRLLWSIQKITDSMETSRYLDKLLGLPNLAPSSQTEIAQSFIDVLDTFTGHALDQEVLYQAVCILPLESIDSPQLLSKAIDALISHPHIRYYPRETGILFRFATAHLQEKQIRDLSLLAIKKLFPDDAMRVLSHLGADRVLDAAFQDTIVDKLVDQLNHYRIDAFHTSDTHSSEYIKKNRTGYSQEVCKKLALAIAHYQPGDLLECLQALRIAEDTPITEKGIHFRKELAERIIGGIPTMAECFAYLQIDQIVDDVSKKDLFFLLLKASQGRLHNLPSISLQGASCIKECVFAALHSDLEDRKVAQLLEVLQVDTLADKDLKEDIALHVLKKWVFGLESFFAMLQHPGLEADPIFVIVGRMGIVPDLAFTKRALHVLLRVSCFADVATYIYTHAELHPHAQEFFSHTFSQENERLIAKRVLNYRNASMAIECLATFLRHDSVSALSQEKNYHIAFTQICLRPKAKAEPTFIPHTLLPAIFLATWMEDASIQNFPSPLATFLQEYRLELRNELKPLLSSFLRAIESLERLKVGQPDSPHSLPGSRKLALLAHVCNPQSTHTSWQDMVKKLTLLAAVASMNPVWLWLLDAKKDPLTDLTHIFSHCLSDVLSFPDLSLEDTLLGYDKTFGCMRYPGALDVYISNIPTEANKSIFKSFVYSVITGKFLQERYKIEGNAHLTFLQENAPEVLEKWKSQEVQKSIVLVPNKEGEYVSLSTFFAQALARSGGDMQSIEKLCAELLSHEGDVFEEASQNKIKDILSLCRKLGLPLAEDMQRLLISFGGKKAPMALFFSCDWQDIFLMGTEVAHSCLTIKGVYHYNKGLPDACMNGALGLCILRDLRTKKIMRRSAVRLLWNPTSLQPALFFSRVYPHNDHVFTRDAFLLQSAKACAQKFSCSAFFPYPTENTAGTATILESKNSPFTAEYIDEAVERSSLGSYKVKGYELLPDG